MKTKKKASPCVPSGFSFFKVMVGRHYKDIINIPPEFCQAISFLKNEYVYLVDSNGRNWRVKLAKLDKSLIFGEGWSNFVCDRSISTGEFLTFKYLGGKIFQVTIFGISGCDRTYSIKKKPIPSRKETKTPTPARKNDNLHRKHKTCEAAENMYIPSNGTIEKKYKLKHRRSHISVKNIIDRGRKRQARRTREVSTDEHVDRDSRKKPVFVDLTKSYKHKLKKRKNKRVKKLKKVKKSKTHRAEKRAKESILETDTDLSDDDFLEDDSSDTDTDTSEDEFQEESETDIELSADTFQDEEDISEETAAQVEKNLSEPERGAADFIVREDGTCQIANHGITPITCVRPKKKAKNNDDKSKRKKHPSNVEETDNHYPNKRACTTLSREVRNLLSDSVDIGVISSRRKASTLKIVPAEEEDIAPIQVSRDDWSAGSSKVKFYLNFPPQSTWMALPQRLPCNMKWKRSDRRVIILRDSSMKMWPVIYHHILDSPGFSGGWVDFAVENNLIQGDLLEFEPIEGDECMFQVHVSR